MPLKRHRPHDSHSLPACLGELPGGHAALPSGLLAARHPNDRLHACKWICTSASVPYQVQVFIECTHTAFRDPPYGHFRFAGISGTTSPLHGIRSSISVPEPLLRDASLQGGRCSNLAPAPDLPRTDFGPGFLAYVQSQNVFGAPSTPSPGTCLPLHITVLLPLFSLLSPIQQRLVLIEDPLVISKQLVNNHPGSAARAGVCQPMTLAIVQTKPDQCGCPMCRTADHSTAGRRAIRTVQGQRPTTQTAALPGS